MSKTAEKAVVGQFRGKNVFDGSHASPYNLSSFQKISQSFMHPKVEKRQFLVVAKLGMYFLQRAVEEMQFAFSTMAVIVNLRIRKKTSDTKVSRSLNYHVTMIYSVLVLNPAL